jgi:hypothetical protein
VKKLVVTLVGMLVLGLVGPIPAQAVEVDTDSSRSSVLNVFWYSKRKVERGTVRTTWYVGIYQSGDELWSDLYQSAYRCRREDGRRRCSRLLWRYGDITDLGDGSFTLQNDLSEGHLSATYELRTWKGGDRLRGTTSWSISTDFEGLGELQKYSYSDSYTSGCDTWRFRSRGVGRSGEAHGTLTVPDGEVRDLGETYSAYAATGKRFQFIRTCDDGGDEGEIVG